MSNRSRGQLLRQRLRAVNEECRELNKLKDKTPEMRARIARLVDRRIELVIQIVEFDRTDPSIRVG